MKCHTKEINQTDNLDDCNREDLLGLIEFYRQALEVQGKTVRQLVIAKVCRWLQENCVDIVIGYLRGYTVDDFVEQFKKAMQDESE